MIDKGSHLHPIHLPNNLLHLSEIIQRRALSGVLIVLWIIVPYSLAQQVAIREVLWVTPTAFDLAIPVNFYGLWPYVTFYGLLMWIGLGVEDVTYKRYIRSIFWIALFSHLVFFLVPNGVSRQAVDATTAPKLYQWLVALDEPRNAFPSLHASLSVLAGLAACSSRKFNLVMRVIVLLWVFGILWSTISLRQHYVVDLVSGGGLALLVWGVGVRGFQKRSPLTVPDTP